MRKLILAFVALATLTSCSDDKDVTIVEDVNVTGTWEEVAWQAATGGPWMSYDCNVFPSDKITYTFNEDGSFVLMPSCSMPSIGGATGTYTVHGNVLTFTSEGESYTFEVSNDGMLYLQRFDIINNDERGYHKKSMLVRLL